VVCLVLFPGRTNRVGICRCGRDTTDPSWGQRDAQVDISKSSQLQFSMTRPSILVKIAEFKLMSGLGADEVGCGSVGTACWRHRGGAALWPALLPGQRLSPWICLLTLELAPWNPCFFHCLGLLCPGPCVQVCLCFPKSAVISPSITQNLPCLNSVPQAATKLRTRSQTHLSLAVSPCRALPSSGLTPGNPVPTQR